MTGLLVRAAAWAISVAAIAFVGTHLPVDPVDRSSAGVVASVVILVLAVADWVAPLLAWRALRRDPTVTALRDQVWRFVVTAAGAGVLGVIAALYLAGYRLADGGGLLVLSIALVTLNIPPLLWTINFYRRR